MEDSGGRVLLLPEGAVAAGVGAVIVIVACEPRLVLYVRVISMKSAELTDPSKLKSPVSHLPPDVWLPAANVSNPWCRASRSSAMTESAS